MSEEQAESKHYGGINRTGYVIWNLLFSVGQFIVFFILYKKGLIQNDMDFSDGYPLSFLIFLIVSLVIMLVLTALRLQNIGKNKWLTLLTLIPVVNILITLCCLVCPEGSQDSKKLDSAGIISLILIIGFIILMFMEINGTPLRISIVPIDS
ncbi:MAG: DUF805 domain-containing protein [Endozoicomonadaceae bacterium]|nr:DUF805 domain-containing protein [Endozoicomonadaceae bacterium]